MEKEKRRWGTHIQNGGQESTDGEGPPSSQHNEWKQDPHHGTTIMKLPYT